MELEQAERDPIRSENRLGLLNMVVALAWQLCMFITVIAAVWHHWDAMFPALAAFLALSVMLYFSWYRKLAASGVGADDHPERG
jgi:CHASE2 domain-containing sensor protein